MVEHVQSNAELLRKTKREMVRRHCLHQKRKDMQDKESSDAGGDGDDDGPGDGSDPDEDADQLAARLAAGGAADDEDPNSGGRVEMLREPRPEPGSTEDAREADPDWARRNTEERVSAAPRNQPRIVRKGLRQTLACPRVARPGSVCCLIRRATIGLTLTTSATSTGVSMIVWKV